MSQYYDRGINSVIPSQRAIPSTLMDPKIKNRSRMWYQMANIEVSKVEGDNNWAYGSTQMDLLLKELGDNFFMVKDGVVITPEGRNILRGISDYVIEIAKELNIPAIEKNIEPYDVYTADEAFLTGTPFCILPTTQLNGQDIGDGKMGEITRRLLKKWSENVGLDIEAQIRKYGQDIQSNKNISAPTPYQFKKRIILDLQLNIDDRQVVILLGGTGAVGLAIAEGFLVEGLMFAFIGRNKHKLKESYKYLSDKYENQFIIIIFGDASIEGGAEKIYSKNY